ncbi:hypothetical protein Sgly_2866 [Syntrophobotulus glycolicus DSM 8271]|uniref:Uncharacterized protein n=1 Tax=Syntrophobotulus glycolicus (strain DSM 8271 / FlGlyR) TaxID=645991 RepID=F0SZ18_SYNGF|nr:hypothetical protein Sgly_2866 [Syntrophobotulus glycolicus DSM 8271]
MKNNQFQLFCENLMNNLTVIKGYVDLSREKAEMKFSAELTEEITEMTTKIKECLTEISRKK